MNPVCVCVCSFRGVFSSDYINSSWESSRERSAVINCGSFFLSQHRDSVFVFHYFPEAPSSWKTGLLHTCILVLNWDTSIFKKQHCLLVSLEVMDDTAVICRWNNRLCSGISAHNLFIYCVSVRIAAVITSRTVITGTKKATLSKVRPATATRNCVRHINTGRCQFLSFPWLFLVQSQFWEGSLDTQNLPSCCPVTGYQPN